MFKRIDKKINFLNRIGNFVSAYISCIICKSIIAFHFEYYVILIINMSETQRGVQRAQNRTMTNYITL